MALSYLKTKTRSIILTLLLLVVLPATALATMPVLDNAALVKLTDQLTKLQQQIQATIDVKNKVQEQIDAIGAVGKITIPTINIDALGAAIKRDAQCLMPDFSKLMPEINFEEMEINSVCEGAPVYRQTLWLDPDDIAELPTWELRDAARKKVAARRERVFVDTVSKALAHADVATQDAVKTNKATDDLESTLDAAVDSRTTLHAIGDGQIVIARALTKQNQILAQLLKVQAAFAMRAGVPVEGLAAVDAGESGERQ